MDPQVGQSLDGLSFISVPNFVSICSCEYFVIPSKKDSSTYTLAFLLLEVYVICELYLGYSELLG
jgi:hypothetical protein